MCCPVFAVRVLRIMKNVLRYIHTEQGQVSHVYVKTLLTGIAESDQFPILSII